MFKPLGARLVVRPDSIEKITKAGIIIPDNAKNKSKSRVCTVVSVGPKVTDAEPGQMVIIDEYAGSEFPLNDEIVRLIEQRDILGILEEENVETNN